jgi:AraC-like DNA-binding protein
MKTNIELAEELGVSERHFYRLLRSGDSNARSLWRDNYVMSEFARLLLLGDYLNRFAGELEKGAPELFKQIRNCTASLITWAFPEDGRHFEDKLRIIASKPRLRNSLELGR